MEPAFSQLSVLPRRFFALRPRTRRWVLIGVFGCCYLFSAVMQLTTWSRGAPAGFLPSVLYPLAVFLSFGALWLLLSVLLQGRTPTPAASFGGALAASVIILICTPLLRALPGPSSSFSSADVPQALGTVISLNATALLTGAFAFTLLLCLRSLVLFKRTRTSQRNWYLMLGLMVFASLLRLGSPPDAELTTWQGLFLAPAVLMMIANSFRLSWMVFLSTQEKWTAIGLSLGLLAPLSINLAQGSDGGLYSYVAHYSPVLSYFARLAVMFGILYATTAFLSLLFHLPTTSAVQQKTGEITALHALSSLSRPLFEVDKLLNATVASPVKAGLAHAAWLVLPSGPDDVPTVQAAHKIAPERAEELVDVPACYRALIDTQTPLLLDEAPADDRVEARAGYDGLDSLLVLPLVARDDMMGALFLSKEVAYGFEDDDVEAANVFAGQIAMSLDNARLFEEHVEKERLEREMDIARSVQQRLLPQQLPSVRGLSLAASSVPAREIGGDYYDVVAIDEDRLALIIADVSGKGTSAAFYMAELQGVFRSLSRLALPPAEFLNHANQALADALEKHVFISAFYGVIDLQDETFTMARAGHCPIATINLHGETTLLRPNGLGLGLDRGPLFRQALEEKTLDLQPGDVFALYTDGVVESRSPEGTEYGYERLQEALQEHRHEEADELHAALLNDLNTFTNARYDDDMTLFVLKWHGLDLAQIQAETTREHAAPAATGSSLQTR